LLSTNSPLIEMTVTSTNLTLSLILA
jgi:hypothetical protein